MSLSPEYFERVREGASRRWDQLEHEPLQLKAELWSMIDKYPDTCSLILTDSEGEPTQLSGDNLCSMRENGKITLHPATYRIVYENDN